MPDLAPFQLRCREADTPVREAPFAEFHGARHLDIEGPDFFEFVAPPTPVPGLGGFSARPRRLAVPHPDIVVQPRAEMWRVDSFTRPSPQWRVPRAVAAAVMAGPMALVPAAALGADVSPHPEMVLASAMLGTAAWDAVVGRKVELSLVNGTSIVGEILSHDGNSVVVARSSDGSIHTFEKDDIDDLRIVTGRSESSDRDDRDHHEMGPHTRRQYGHARAAIATGVTFTWIGAGILTAFGVAMVATSGSYYAAPAGVLGTTFLSVGIPLWAVGQGVASSIQRKRRRGSLAPGSGLYLGIMGSDRKWEGRLVLRF